MDLNQLVFTRLGSDESITALLTTFGGQPAIFNTEFPDDMKEGWNGRTQYPRIEYQINMQVDTQRSSSGTLRILVYTEKNPIIAEQIETLIRRSLKDVLMKPTGEAPFCMAWARTDPYLIEGQGIYCKDILFDVLEYPDQETTDPDPVAALSHYIKNLYDDTIVLGIDRIGEYTSPADTPIWYCRLESIQSADGPCTHTITWFNCVIAVHLLCPDAAMRLKMIAGLNQRLANAAEVIMLDDSPMQLPKLTVNNRADYLRAGQLTVNGYYGCLKDKPLGLIVRNVVIEEKDT